MILRFLLTTLMLATALTGIRADDLTLWGYSLSDEFNYSGYGSPSYYSPPLSCAIWVPGDGELKGAKIHAVNIPITSDDYTDISVWGVEHIEQYSTSLGTKLFSKAYKGSIKANTRQRVDLDTPYAIPETGMFVGFTFTTRSGYPFGMCSGYAAGSSWDNGWNRMWYDVSEDKIGVSAIQIFVSGLTLSGSSVDIETIKCRRTENGKEAVAKVSVTSTSEEPVTSIDYTVTFGQDKLQRNLQLSTPIAEGLAQKGKIELSFVAPSTDGTHTGTLSIDKVNGKANSSKAEPTAFSIRTAEHIVPRLTIVEEFTGTGCGNCPRGWLGMKRVKEEMSDYAAVIAIHQYNMDDPMYCPYYSTVEYDGAPSCHVDRTIINADPWQGDATGDIFEIIDRMNDVDPSAMVTLEANFTDATNSAISLKASTRFIENCSGSSIAFVLTADELSGTTNNWRQSNYLYEKDAAGYGELGIFCAGGEYGNSYVFLTYDDVLIGSSWDAQKSNTAPAYTTCTAGAEQQTEMTLTPKWGTALRNALHYDKLYATALVIGADGRIVNAARCRVLPAGDATGIDAVSQNTTSMTRQQTYDLQGRVITPTTQQASRGLLISAGRKIIR